MTATAFAAPQRSQESKAASAYELMRARLPREAPTLARIRTRKVGFKLGGFGFTYTAKDLETGQPQPSPPQAATLAPSSPLPASGHSLPRRTLSPETSALVRKRGHGAYAAQLRRPQEESAPVSILLSVV